MGVWEGIGENLWMLASLKLERKRRGRVVGGMCWEERKDDVRG